LFRAQETATAGEEHLPRRHPSHHNVTMTIADMFVTTTIADLLSCDTTNDTQLIQEYLASNTPNIIEVFHHTVWHSSIIEELHRNVRYRNDITPRRYIEEMGAIFVRCYEDDISFQFPRHLRLPHHLRFRLFLLGLRSINPFQNVNDIPHPFQLDDIPLDDE
jgi:hypothetical protein